MKIKLKGYYADIQNVVYSREAECAHRERHREAIILRRYTEPSEDEVVAYLKAKVCSLSDVDASERLATPRTSLENLILSLPQEVRTDLKTGDDETSDFIRRNTPARIIKPGDIARTYLEASLGVLPSELVDSGREAGETNNLNWWYAQFNDGNLSERGLGSTGTICLRLSADSLPSRQDINILLKHEVYTSRTLQISGYLRYKRVRELVRVFYAELNKPKYIALLQDRTADALDNAALVAVRSLHRAIQENDSSEIDLGEINHTPPSFMN